MVFAFAGDSTITSFLPVSVAISRATLARRTVFAILAADARSSSALSPVQPDCGAFVADRAVRVPLPGVRDRASARHGRVRPGCGARLQPRSLAARARDLAGPVPALHGQVRALLVSALRRPPPRWRLQGAPRPA